MRKMACMSRPLALAEPVPFTFASLKAKSFMRWLPIRARALHLRSGYKKFKLLHVPSRRRTAFRAETAVDTNVLVFRHDARRFEAAGRTHRAPGQIQGRRRKPRAQIRLLAIPRDRQALHRANIYAGIAFDTAWARENRLHIAIQAALPLHSRSGRRVNPSSTSILSCSKRSTRSTCLIFCRATGL